MSTRQRTDELDPARATALWAVLGQRIEVAAGDALPPFFHQIYFWESFPPEDLGADGHPARGLILPDMGFPKRMWAGGRLRFHAPLRAGRPAQKITRTLSATEKVGRAGSMGFVTMQHELHQDGRLCIAEEQDLVFLPEEFARPPALQVPDTPADHNLALSFDATALFRYSALTFNGHRIHYDRPFAVETEGYGGLVVHGPLLAQHLMLLAQDHLGPLEQFEFRATAPLMDFEAAQARIAGDTLWIAGPGRRQCMIARAMAA